VRRAIGNLRGQLVLGLEDTGSRMTRLGKAELTHASCCRPEQVLDCLAAVTVEDVRAVAGDVLPDPGAGRHRTGGRRRPRRSARMIRVAVLGARGRVGSEVVRAVEARRTSSWPRPSTTATRSTCPAPTSPSTSPTPTR
jgi:hypothetical protein